MDISAVANAPIIQFTPNEGQRLHVLHNDALVITVTLANYEINSIFMNSRSSVDILFAEAYDQMELGNVPLKSVDTSLYSFAGEVVRPRGQTLNLSL